MKGAYLYSLNFLSMYADMIIHCCFFIIADMLMYADEYDMEFILFFIGIIQKCSKIFPLVYILSWTYVLLGDSKKKGNGCRSDRLLA